MLPAAMPPCPDWPLFTAVFGMPEEERAVEYAGLLGVGHAWSLRGGCVCEHFPRAPSEAESPDIGTGGVGGVVLGFTLGQCPVLLIRKWVVPCGGRGWYRDREKHGREYLQNSLRSS